MESTITDICAYWYGRDNKLYVKIIVNGNFQSFAIKGFVDRSAIGEGYLIDLENFGKIQVSEKIYNHLKEACEKLLFKRTH